VGKKNQAGGKAGVVDTDILEAIACASVMQGLWDKMEGHVLTAVPPGLLE
jgi:hypothetical protein